MGRYLMICNACRFARLEARTLLCEDGRTCREHISAGNCPRGRFAARGAGDVVEDTLAALRLANPAKRLIAWATGGPCNCNRRREVLNQLIPFGQSDPT